MKQNKYDRAIVRAYRSDNVVDSAAPHKLYNARAAGISGLDIYMFPCPHCSDAVDQVKTMLAGLESYNASFFDMLWLDIEDTSQHAYWGPNSQVNRQWMQSLYQAAVGAVGASRVGIYSSHTMWNLIFSETDWACCQSAPLWYAEYDGGISFSDFEPFGGWTSPVGKQFAGSVTLCSAGVDESYFMDNWRENSKGMK